MDVRGEAFLLAELARLHKLHRETAAGQTGVDRDVVAPADGAIDALVAVAAMSPEEADSWRERVREALTGASDALDEEVSERARAHVAQLLDQISPSRRERSPASRQLSDVLNAFRHVGVFDEREMDTWLKALAERRGRAPMQRAEDDEEPRCRLSELRRVVAGPRERRGGVRVIGFEIYDDGVVLRWHLARLPPDDEGRIAALPDEVEGGEAARRARRPRFSLEDDCGTSYRFYQGAGFGGKRFGARVVSGSEIFTPTVPPAARRLSAVTTGFRFEVHL